MQILTSVADRRQFILTVYIIKSTISHYNAILVAPIIVRLPWNPWHERGFALIWPDPGSFCVLPMKSDPHTPFIILVHRSQQFGEIHVVINGGEISEMHRTRSYSQEQSKTCETVRTPHTVLKREDTKMYLNGSFVHKIQLFIVIVSNRVKVNWNLSMIDRCLYYVIPD